MNHDYLERLRLRVDLLWTIKSLVLNRWIVISNRQIVDFKLSNRWFQTLVRSTSTLLPPKWSILVLRLSMIPLLITLTLLLLYGKKTKVKTYKFWVPSTRPRSFSPKTTFHSHCHLSISWATQTSIWGGSSKGHNSLLSYLGWGLNFHPLREVDNGYNKKFL